MLIVKHNINNAMFSEKMSSTFRFLVEGVGLVILIKRLFLIVKNIAKDDTELPTRNETSETTVRNL